VKSYKKEEKQLSDLDLTPPFAYLLFVVAAFDYPPVIYLYNFIYSSTCDPHKAFREKKNKNKHKKKSNFEVTGIATN
jgi:hypothetical protein